MLIDTMSNFKKNNPVIAAETIALEEDTGVFKKGDGKTHYNDLPEAGCDVTGTMQKATAAATITIPLNSDVAFPIGTEIDIMAYTDGDVAIAGDTDEVGDPPEEVSVKIKSASDYVKIGAQYGVATLKKMDEDEWALYGSLKAT